MSYVPIAVDYIDKYIRYIHKNKKAFLLQSVISLYECKYFIDSKLIDEFKQLTKQHFEITNQKYDIEVVHLQDYNNCILTINIVDEFNKSYMKKLKINTTRDLVNSFDKMGI